MARRALTGPKRRFRARAAGEELPLGLVPCPPELSRLTFKITQVGFRSVREAFKSGGMIGLAKGSEWNALWGKIDLGSYQNLKAYQRINHFPGTWQVRDSAADLL